MRGLCVRLGVAPFRFGCPLELASLCSNVCCLLHMMHNMLCSKHLTVYQQTAWKAGLEMLVLALPSQCPHIKMSGLRQLTPQLTYCGLIDA